MAVQTQQRQVSNGFISWFKNLFVTARQYLIYGIGSREVIAQMDEVKAVTEGFDSNAAVYSIIVTDAEKFASIPLYLADPKKLEAKKKKFTLQFKHLIKSQALPNSQLSKLLQQPNPYQGQAAFTKTVRAYYKVCGNAFIWLNRGDVSDLTDIQQDLKPVLEMYPLPSHFVEVIPDPGNVFGVIGYIFNVNGVKLPLRKNDVIHMKDINLDFDGSSKQHLRGMTALRPGSLSLQQNNDSARSAVRMYQNDGAKGAMYNETHDDITPVQQTQIEGVINKKINNNDIKGAVAVVQGKWGYLDFGKSSIDLGLMEGRIMSMKELCFLFGVPYELFDPATTFANKEQAQKSWVINRIIPARKEFDDELNRQLLRAFALEGKAVIVSDFSDMHELQADLAALSAWLLQAWWITPNEKRELQGFEEYSDSTFDEPYLPTGITPLSQMTDGLSADMLSQLGLNNYANNTNGKTNAS